MCGFPLPEQEGRKTCLSDGTHMEIRIYIESYGGTSFSTISVFSRRIYMSV